MRRNRQTVRRYTIVISFVFQAVFLGLVALLLTIHNIPSGDWSYVSNPRVMYALASLSTQFGMQVATARLLSFEELHTVGLSVCFADLAIDPHYCAKENPKRNRRLLSVLTFFIGAISGGWLTRAGMPLMGFLWIAFGLKFLIAVGTLIGIWDGKESLNDSLPVEETKIIDAA